MNSRVAAELICDARHYGKSWNKASRAANAWIHKHFQTHSDEIKRMKDTINEQTAHANVYNSFHNFDFVSGENAAIYTSYFDFDDDYWLKVDLWECAQAGLVAADFASRDSECIWGVHPIKGSGEATETDRSDRPPLHSVRGCGKTVIVTTCA